MNAPTTPAEIAPAPLKIEQSFADLAIEALVPSPTNPRKRFNEETLAELAATIKAQGVLQPILVRPLVGEARLAYQIDHGGHNSRKAAVIAAMNDGATMYEIVAGERRYRASMIAGRTHIPALVRALSNIDVLRIQTIENLQRDDLHELEEAQGYAAMIRDHGFTVDQLAEEVGVSKETIYARLKLNDLRTECRDAFFADQLTASTALLIARIPHDLQPQAMKEIIHGKWNNQDEPMSAREAAKHVREHYMLPIAKAPFDIKAADYMRPPSNNKNASSAVIPIAGPCGPCPKRTHAARDLFHDVQGPDMCTDPLCYRAKTEAHSARLILAAKTEGTKVIAGAEAKKLVKYEHSSHIDGYQAAGQKFWTGSKEIDLKKTLGDEVPITLIENPFNKQVREMVDVEATKRLLRAKGLMDSRSSGDEHLDKARSAEKKARLESEARIAILRATIKTIPLDFDTLLLLANAMWHDAGSDSRRRLCEVLEWDKDLGKFENFDQAKAKLAAMDGAELGGFMVACALVGTCFVNTYNNKPPEDLHEAAARADVDFAGMRRLIMAPAKKRASTPKPAAQARTKAAATAQPAVGAALAKAVGEAKANGSKQKKKAAVAARSEDEKPGKTAQAKKSRATPEPVDPAVDEPTEADALLASAT
jgi:ParB/RepB/Spo0J family partition protein